jgi:ABC-2 type transport system ATP-binding protein/lipopolysaccharide transport system ATP-binding protein
MDEWLTAGDAQFLEKAQRRVEVFVRTSSILVLASHSLELVQQWCNRGILLHQGRTVMIGPVERVIAAYRRLIEFGVPP